MYIYKHAYIYWYVPKLFLLCSLGCCHFRKGELLLFRNGIKPNLKGKAVQPCGWYPTRWCGSSLLGSLILTGRSQRVYCHICCTAMRSESDTWGMCWIRCTSASWLRSACTISLTHPDAAQTAHMQRTFVLFQSGCRTPRNPERICCVWQC